jgi:hypothetical protein
LTSWYWSTPKRWFGSAGVEEVVAELVPNSVVEAAEELVLVDAEEVVPGVVLDEVVEVVEALVLDNVVEVVEELVLDVVVRERCYWITSKRVVEELVLNVPVEVAREVVLIDAGEADRTLVRNNVGADRRRRGGPGVDKVVEAVELINVDKVVAELINIVWFGR